MKVQVQYFLDIALITGKNEETIDVPEKANLNYLLHILVEKYGWEFRNTFFSTDNELASDITVLLNGRHVEKLQENCNNLLNENDAVVLIPPITGG